MDFYPTFAEAIRATPDPRQMLDGVSIVPLLEDPQTSLDRDALMWHYPLEQAHFLGGRSSGAIRSGQHKLIEDFTTGQLELYDLSHDLGEQQDLSQRLPEQTGALHTKLQAWRASLGVQPVRHRTSR